MEKLKFTCKHCNQKLEADLDLVGEKVLCPTCQNELVVSAIIDESYIVLQENIKKYPDLSDFDRAELLINKHEFNAAHHLLQITNLSPNDHLRLEIEFFCQKKEWESAKNLAELYIKLYPDSAIGYRWLAEILDDGFEEREKAIATATKAIELDPKFAEAYVIRGNTKRWLSPADNEGAEEDYNTALQIDSTLGSAYVGLGWIYYDNGDYVKATKKFTESFTYDKGTGYGAWQGLALVLHKLGKLEAAAEVAKAVLYRRLGMDFATCRGGNGNVELSNQVTAAFGKEYVWFMLGKHTRDVSMEDFCRRARRFTAAAAKLGLKAVLHNHLGSRVESQEELDIFMKEVPDGYLLFDIGHHYGANGDVLGTIDKYFDRIASVHFKDVFIKDESKGLDEWSSRLRFCELGAGNCNEPWKEAAELLKKKGYDKWVLIEHDTHLRDPLTDLKVSLDELKKIFCK